MNPDHAIADDLLCQLAELGEDLDVNDDEWITAIGELREMLVIQHSPGNP